MADNLLLLGDSLKGQMPPPTAYMKTVRKWLQSQFPGHWEDRKATLHIGVQRDSISCGICAINAILHAIFGDPLWDQSQAKAQRANSFLKLVDSLKVS